LVQCIDIYFATPVKYQRQVNSVAFKGEVGFLCCRRLVLHSERYASMSVPIAACLFQVSLVARLLMLFTAFL
jgi:hypothetical protein